VEGQPAAPPAPKEYQVFIRYRIRAARNERVAQFREMLAYLESIGFKKEPGPENEAEDPNQIIMGGTIPAANASKILLEQHVRSILLMPPGLQAPADRETPVKVRIHLTPGLSPDRQSLLASQLQGLLQGYGFHPAIGYDDRGHTLLVGTIPARNVVLLLEDLRTHQNGLLVPERRLEDFPSPLSRIWPIRMIEVTPEPAGFPPAREVPLPPPPPPGEEYLLKITPEVQALLAQADQASAPTRMQVILSRTADIDDRGWQRELYQAAPGIVLEGRLGQVVDVVAPPEQARPLAALPLVSTVRLPRPALHQVVQPDTPATDVRSLLRESGIERMHDRGYRGQGVGLAIVDFDFRGYRRLLGKELPAGTKLIDLTAERSPDVQPDPYPGDGEGLGHGTLCAVAAALAAPDAQFYLIRIDPAAPYMLLNLARYINGESVTSLSLEQRAEQFIAEADELRLRRNDLLQERRAVLDNFSQDEAIVKRREAYFKAQAQMDEAARALEQRQARYLQLVRDLQGLRGLRVLVNTLVWNEGYPADGTGALSRYIDDCLSPRTLWLQATGNTHGQSWAGYFRDADADGVMEFAPPDAPLGADRWSRELNFLGWRNLQEKLSPNLPAKARVRISIQWREPHDPVFARLGEDAYRVPLANLQLFVLRQRDPPGKQVPADDMELIARSVGIPQRLHNQAESATYEQTVEFTVDPEGRYALRVEGQVPASIRPSTAPSLPVNQVGWDLFPRIFVNVLDPAARAEGRAVFVDYPTDAGAIGMPAAAHHALAVGAAAPNGEVRAYTARGPVAGAELLVKPDLLAEDGLPLAGADPVFGTGPAAGLAGGMAATAVNAGRRYVHDLPLKSRELLRLP
jgi:hypothetical protein